MYQFTKKSKVLALVLAAIMVFSTIHVSVRAENDESVPATNVEQTETVDTGENAPAKEAEEVLAADDVTKNPDGQEPSALEEPAGEDQTAQPAEDKSESESENEEPADIPEISDVDPAKEAEGTAQPAEEVADPEVITPAEEPAEEGEKQGEAEAPVEQPDEAENGEPVEEAPEAEPVEEEPAEEAGEVPAAEPEKQEEAEAPAEETPAEAEVPAEPVEGAADSEVITPAEESEDPAVEDPSEVSEEQPAEVIEEPASSETEDPAETPAEEVKPAEEAPEEKQGMKVNVSTTWDDMDNLDGIRPDYIEVQLLTGEVPTEGVEPLILNAANGWTGYWEGIPQYDGGQESIYQVAVVGPDVMAGLDGPGTYTYVKEGNAKDGFVITSIHRGPFYYVPVMDRFSVKAPNATLDVPVRSAGQTPTHSKLLIDNHDGTYTLSLDVVGDSERKPNPVNVIVILDHSGSMDTRTGGYGSQTRMAAAQSAVNNLARSLFNYNTTEFPNLVQMALVGFSTTGSVVQTPTNSYDTFSGAVNRLDADGGTNWEDALQDAAGINFNDQDPTYVIFVSDGNPTFRNTRGNYNPMDNYYYNTWRVYGNGSDSQTVDGIQAATTIARCYDHAVDDARTLATAVGVDHFYTIGAYGSVDRMRSLTTDAGAPASNYFSSGNTSELQNALATILAEIEKAGIGSVEIEDGTTNQVSASTGVIELLEVDTTSFKYYKDNAVWTDAPAAQFVNGSVEWDLSSVGVLDDGVKYTVTFDCYPSQYTYDLIAKLKNGDVKYSELDSEVKKYIVDNGNGSYSLRTNTNATLSYDDTRDEAGKQTASYVNPEPVRTDAATMSVTKAWENLLDARAVGSIDMTVLMDNGEFHKVTLSDPNWKAEGIFISPGIIRNGQVLAGAEGHDFTFAELGSEQYNWELVSPVVHPMLIDGKLTMLTLVDENHPAPSGAQTYTINGKTYYSNGNAEASLDAYNYRRSNLNLTKVVTGEDAPEDATFPFTLTVNNSKAANGSADDTNSDYYVWFSIDSDPSEAFSPVTDAIVSGNGVVQSGNYWYAPSGTTITVQMKAGWNLRFTNLPTETTYTFAEGTLADGFAFSKAELTSGKGTFSGGKTSTGTVENTNTSYVVTFTNDYQLTDLEITKVWDDGGNQDGKRLTPDELKAKLTLSPAVEGKEPTVKDNGDNTYTITYTGLPRFNDGKEVTYTVTEAAIDGYTTTGNPAQDHGTITNTHTPEVTSVTVVKVWDDSDDIGKIRPASIQAQLTVDGTASGDPVTLNADNKWTYTWKNLPKYKAGKEIVYSADETAVPAGYTKTGPVKTTADGTVTFTVTNTYNPTPVKVDPPVQKIITGNDNLYNKGNFTFTIVAVTEGAPMPKNTSVTNSETYELANKPGFYEFGEITFTMPGTYTYKVTESGTVAGVTNDPAATTGKEITFTVTDDGTGKLTVTPTTDQVQLSFTNVYNANGEASIVVTKAITGAAWPAGKTLTLTISGAEGAPMPETTTASLTAAGSATFGPIKYALTDAGKTYTYTISEDGFGKGWSGSGDITATVKVTDNGDGTLKTEITYSPENKTITNTYKATGTAVLEATKAIEGAAWPKDATITFTLSGEGGTLPETVTVELTEAGKATFGAIKYTEADAGQTYTYTISEDGFGDGWTGSGSITATVKVTDNGDGTLKTEVTYSPENKTITNTYKATGTAVLEATKAIEGAAWPTGKTITFTLSGEGGTLPETVTVELTEAGKATFGAIKYTEADAGKTYTYTISEDGFGKGWTGSGDITATVKVTDNGDGTLKTEVTYSPENATITNTYKAKGEMELFAGKKLEAEEGLNAPDVSGKYTLTLEGQEGAPMPEGSINGKAVIKNADGDGTMTTFGKITFTEAHAGKTYTYKVTETGTVAGVTNGTSEYTVTVTVKDNGDGTLTVTATPDAETLFTNTYSVEPTTSEFSVEKVLEVPEGLEGPADWSFDIKVEAMDGAPEAEVMTGIITSEKPVLTFSGFNFSKPGTYIYKVTESGEVAGVTNDEAAVAGLRITITVVDNGDGTLTATASSTKEKPLVITNTYSVEPVTASIPVQKLFEVPEQWKDLSDFKGLFTFKLTAEDGTPLPEVVSYTNPDKDGGLVVFGDIKFVLPGTYTYTVTETGTVKGVENDKESAKTVTISVTDNQDGTLSAEVSVSEEKPLTFKNTVTLVDLTVVKKWEDSQNQDGKRPEQIVVTLFADGKAIDEVNLNEANKWTYTFKDLPEFKDQTAIVYTVEEAAVEGYTPSYEGLTITNTHPAEKVKVSVSKVWDDKDDVDGVRPESISVQLLADGVAFGEAVKLDEAGKWAYTWEKLDKYKAGKQIIYTIKEIEVPEYTAELKSETDKDGNVTVTLTNTHITYVKDDPPVLKKLTGDKPEKKEAFSFKLKAISNTAGLEALPMPEGATGQEMTITAMPDVETEFGWIVFTKEGTYVYEISEVNTGLKNYTYDTTVYTLTYHITKEGTSLVKELIITVDGKETDKAVYTFTNNYKKEKPPTPPETPDTGDHSNLGLWAATTAVSFVGAMFMVLAIRRKKEEEV